MTQILVKDAKIKTIKVSGLDYESVGGSRRKEDAEIVMDIIEDFISKLFLRFIGENNLSDIT